MELDELLAAINGFADKDKLVEAMKRKASSIYQPIFNDGHAVATAAGARKLTSTDEKLKEATEALTAAQSELTELKAKQPDVAKLHDEYGKKIERLEKKITDLKAAHTAEKRDAVRNSTLLTIRAKLSEAVDPDYAEALVSKESFKNRVTVDEQDVLRIMQNGQSIPFAGSVDEQIAAVVDELKKGVKPQFLRSDVSAGTGTEHPAGNGLPAGGKAKFFNDIREKAKKVGQSPNGEEKIDPIVRLHQHLGMIQQ